MSAKGTWFWRVSVHLLQELHGSIRFVSVLRGISGRFGSLTVRFEVLGVSCFLRFHGSRFLEPATSSLGMRQVFSTLLRRPSSHPPATPATCHQPPSLKPRPTHPARPTASRPAMPPACRASIAKSDYRGSHREGGDFHILEAMDLPGEAEPRTCLETGTAFLYVSRKWDSRGGGGKGAMRYGSKLAAMRVGVMEQSMEVGATPSRAKLLEFLELVQVGSALLTGGRRKATTGRSHMKRMRQKRHMPYNRHGHGLARLHNLMVEAATGVGVFVDFFCIETGGADVVGLARGGVEQPCRLGRDPPDATHVYEANKSTSRRSFRGESCWKRRAGQGTT